ncbi:transglutaminase-like domain-containing protein [Thermococcus sp.]
MRRRTSGLIVLLLTLMVITAGCVTVTRETPTQSGPVSSTTVSTTSTTTATPPATWTNPFVMWNNSEVKLPPQDAQLNCPGILWRYVLKDALSCILGNEELRVISPLAEELKANSTVQSVWNILGWEGEWISYDWEKAKEPFPRVVIYPNGTEEVVQGKNNTIQTPYETIMRRTGICTDYTVLTDALLLAMNYSPVYAVEINFTTPPNHAAAAIKINGWFFVLDQHLPPMNLGAYYRYWERQGKEISNATFYEISRGGERASVKSLGTVPGTDFMKQDYTMTSREAKNLAIVMMNLLYEKFGIKADERLQNMENGTLPSGYKAGWTWRVRYYNMADYYHPFFREQYARWFLGEMAKNSEFMGYLQKSKAAWVNVRIEGDDLLVTIYLGSS